jgi:Trk-type K+ transport system membrane component
MFIGRLGPLTVAVALGQRAHAKEHVEYITDRVMIG